MQILGKEGVWRQIHRVILPGSDKDNVSITLADEEPGDGWGLIN